MNVNFEYTIGEVAKQLKCSTVWVKKLIKKFNYPVKLVGNRKMAIFSKEDVIALEKLWKGSKGEK